MRKNSYTQEFKESTVKFCIDNSDRSTSPVFHGLPPRFELRV
ncbi:hypothetical protein [Aliarcobacter cibarius]|nr:hypothetical protein [Aliarcobacter cibarius]